ncbi:MAG: DUF1349 domain-containing protein [Aggregatilineales bacterium]
MKWLNEPPHWQDEQGKITIEGQPDTDFWRVTRHDYIVDNGHFYYQPVEGNFSATVKVTGDYAELYDQAGLMIRESEAVWVKCGIEFVDGVHYASVVITRDFSDWSIVPLENPSSMWFRVSRIDTTIEVYYSHDGQDFVLFRQGYLTATPTLQVGMMVAVPKGAGFTAIFENFMVKSL